ncbi:MAG TPA: cobalt-precorrin-6A reductase [Aestuariivirgaceae bacterium]
MRRHVLILGGSAEARKLANLLVEKDFEVTTSLAGRTTAPLLPQGKVRIGNFGGSEGLQHFVRQNAIQVIADASHPFAAQISAHGFAAAQSCGITYLRLERPAWQRVQGDVWICVQTTAEAVTSVPRDARILLTIGRRQMQAFTQRTDLSGVIRTIERPSEPVGDRWLLLLARPPFTVESELSLMRQHRIDLLVTKNSGGDQTAAKLTAARSMRLPVIMIERPAKPQAPTAATPEELAVLICNLPRSGVDLDPASGI